MFLRIASFVFLLILPHYFSAYCQFLPSGYPLLEEVERRNQIMGEEADNYSFILRPISKSNLIGQATDSTKKKLIDFHLLPFLTNVQWNSNRPYGSTPFGMLPNTGIQLYNTLGIHTNLWVFNLQLQPEFIYARSKPYQGYYRGFSNATNLARFRYWNYGDYPERFSEDPISTLWWGQSSFTAQIGAFELGFASRSIWWGPGQWNALTFSNNARGFPHFSVNTYKPAKTFLGSFEGQLLIGRLTDSGIAPSQNETLNSRYFRNFSGDWRYVNGLSVSYNPKWVPGLFLGFTRTFHQYSDAMGNTLADFFPVFDVLQKKKVFENNNSVAFDRLGRDQQVTLFGRLVFEKSKSEFYFEFGRRDHAYDWRDAILNPEHARAYLLGFIKVVTLNNDGYDLQIRGEMLHQQESVNRYIRYAGLLGGNAWQTHYLARGFANYGQSLGVGAGTGANLQTIEIAFVNEYNKQGLVFERLANHQDFYYRAFGQQKEVQPWVDLSLGLLFDHRWNNLLVSSKLQFINGLNYQWQLDPSSTPEFPKGQHLFSIHSQVSLIYLFQKNQKLTR